jgi:hypothetical protein
MADLPQVKNEGDLVTLADMSTMNVFAQLEIDDLDLAEEIRLVIAGEIRRVEIEFSIMLMDLRKNFSEDIASLKAAGKLPEGHILDVLGESAGA